MIIHGPSNYDYDIDLGPVFLQDCESHPLYGKKRQSDNDLGFHKDYFTIVEQRASVTHGTDYTQEIAKHL